MAINLFKTNFRLIGNQITLRPDPKYRYFWDIKKGIIYKSISLIPLNQVMKEIKVSKLKKGELDDYYSLLNISDQTPRNIELENIEKINKIGSDKNPLWEADLIISKLGLPKGYIYVNEKKYPKLIGSTELISYKIINDNFNHKFLRYFLSHEEILKYFTNLESGKTPSHKRVNPFDLLKIRIPSIPKSIQNQIVSQIEPIEEEIKALKSQMAEPLNVINQVFAREFNFDLENFEELKRQNILKIKFNDFSHSSLFRTTTIYNHPSGVYLRNFLSSGNFTNLESILTTKKIQRGKQPEYSDEGIKVIKTLNIQKGKIDYSEVQFVSEQFYLNSQEKAGIQKNDLLLTSTGMGRGKFALYEDEEPALADSHISIIRFDTKKIIPLFLNYFCQSVLGIGQLKYIEMQIKGTPEIYEPQLKKLRVPNIQDQQTIVDEIKSELIKQEEIRTQIEAKRKKIDLMIESAL